MDLAEFAEELEEGLQRAIRHEELSPDMPVLIGSMLLTPLSIWEFVGIDEAVESGRLIPSHMDDIDTVRGREDLLICNTLYQSAVQNVPEVAYALELTCFEAFGEERARDASITIVTYQGFRGMQPKDAIAAIALALQATFEYGSGDTPLAILSIEVTLGLVATQLSKCGEGTSHLDMLQSELRLPIHGDDCETAISSCMESLKSVGQKLVAFMRVNR